MAKSRVVMGEEFIPAESTQQRRRKPTTMGVPELRERREPAAPPPVDGPVTRQQALKEIAAAERDFKHFLGMLGRSRETAIALQRFEEASAWMLKHSIKHLS